MSLGVSPELQGPSRGEGAAVSKGKQPIPCELRLAEKVVDAYVTDALELFA